MWHFRIINREANVKKHYNMQSMLILRGLEAPNPATAMSEKHLIMSVQWVSKKFDKLAWRNILLIYHNILSMRHLKINNKNFENLPGRFTLRKYGYFTLCFVHC